ncbi:lipoyl synthase [Spirochaetia bacterium 38H-sp]|uniref:Lipoyl synthase n=1 Tax=Rarispira pelagica TaxID=3141764 RepID=A0ABU9UAG7_9SPIR
MSIEYLRKPEWLKIDLGLSDDLKLVKKELRDKGLSTVCEEARCPNLHECWGKFRTATFLLLGDVCTRLCKFCSVKHGRPSAVDKNEPTRVADAVKRLGIRHVVLTMVTRDDLVDGGASIVAGTVRAVRGVDESITTEVLVSDFRGNSEALSILAESEPDIVSHNIETVRALTPKVRSGFSYDASLEFLKKAGEAISSYGGILKSSLMLGLGETEEDVRESLMDLRHCGVRIVNIGQYLQPSKEQISVVRYVRPEEFYSYKEYALSIGFDVCNSGPLVRSSYHAEDSAGLIGSR